jgi:pyruvate/2-oxoglutarate dehydrogenase complex dihydrolipoamide acyltransferase (E2) component
MIDRTADPRTEDVIVFDLLQTEQGAEARVVGTATFRNGASSVEAPDAIRVAVEELLGRAFVDRVQADERPRGYRRSGRGIVDMLVPGMAEHFIARLRGLWLSYPDGSVVTARQRTGASASLAVADAPDSAPPVTDAATRRSTLAGADRAVNKSPLVRSHAPETGIRPAQALAHRGTGPVGRSDCGWLV